MVGLRTVPSRLRREPLVVASLQRWASLAPLGFLFSFLSLSFLFFVFLGLHPWHMEVPRLGVETEL